MEAHSKKLDSLDMQLIEAGLKTPPESSDSEDGACSSDTSSEAEMQTEEAQEGKEEVEGDASIPMDDGGAEAATVVEEEETNKVEAEEENNGDVTKVENCLLDTPPLQTQNRWIQAPLTLPVRSPKSYQLKTDRLKELPGSLFTKELSFDLRGGE